MVALLFGPLLLAYVAPSSWSLPALQKAEPASAFLTTMWQVEAAALALSLALIVFSLQAVSGSRTIRSLAEFARASLFIDYLALGVSSIILTAAVLLGLGNGAPGGWAATWSVAWAGLVTLTIPFVFLRVIRTVDPEHLNRWRITDLRRQVGLEVDRQLLERIALYLISREESEGQFRFEPYFPVQSTPGVHVVIAGRAGHVRDIRISRLWARPGDGGELPSLRVRIGSRVVQGTPLIVLPGGSQPVDAYAAAIGVRISGAGESDEVLRSLLERLGAEALEVVREGRDSEWDDIQTAYADSLLEFPAAWQRYGERYSVQAAATIEIIGLSTLDLVEHQIALALAEAVAGRSREIATSLAYLPVRIAFDALELRSHALTRTMLALCRLVHQLELHHGTERTQAMWDRADSGLRSYASYAIAPLVRPDDSAGEEGGETEFLSQYVRVRAQMAKDAIDVGSARRAEEAIAAMGNAITEASAGD